MPPTPTLVQDQVSQETSQTRFRVTKDKVIQAISAEATAKGMPCDSALARQIYDMLELAVERAPALPKERKILHHLDDEELVTLHDVLEVVMLGHNTSPEPETAHALINEHFYPGGTYTLVHTVAPGRLVVDCAVTVDLLPI
jgi:hypothetical protein